MTQHSYGPDVLQQYAGVLKSRMGTFFPGSHVVYRGKGLHTALKDMDWMELWVFGITGRRFSPEQLRLMHAIWTYTSYADVRLWNNRVAALSASSRSTSTLGLAAGLAVSEAAIYGSGIFARTLDFFSRTVQRLEAGDALRDCLDDELKTYRSIGGFGRPLVNGDERIPPMLALAKELGLDGGRYLRLAFSIEEALLGGRHRMKMNYLALVAALSMDMGLSKQELRLLMFPVFLAGMPPPLIEAAERPEGTLYPLRCADVLYDGPQQRSWRDRGSTAP